MRRLDVMGFCTDYHRINYFLFESFYSFTLILNWLYQCSGLLMLKEECMDFLYRMSQENMVQNEDLYREDLKYYI